MRTLIIVVLAATLVGCGCSVSPNTQACTGTDGSGFACLDRTAVNQTIEPEAAALSTKYSRPKPKPKVAAKREKESSGQDHDSTHVVAVAPSSTKAETAPSPEPPAPADVVTTKAKLTIATKLESPASAEFGEMKRAMRTNTLGQSVDTICGRVKIKKASGESTGEMPFLYLVKDDEAYVVDGPPNSAAATAYRNICN